MEFSKLLSIAANLKDLLEKSDVKVSNLIIEIDDDLSNIYITNIGDAEAYNISMEFKNSNWNNPIKDSLFSLSPKQTKQIGIFLMDLNTDTSDVELNWTDETKGDFYKTFLVGHRR